MLLPKELWQIILKLKSDQAWNERKKRIHDLLSSTLFREPNSIFDFHRSVVTFYRSDYVELTIVDSLSDIDIYFVIYKVFEGKFSTKLRAITQPPYSLK